jgi:hypothetical protein
MDVFITIKIASPLEEQLFYFMAHKNGEVNYMKIKIGAFMNGCS